MLARESRDEDGNETQPTGDDTRTRTQIRQTEFGFELHRQLLGGNAMITDTAEDE